MRLNQVTLPVTNMELAAAFYRKMGFLQISTLRITPAFPALVATLHSRWRYGRTQATTTPLSILNSTTWTGRSLS